jgi:hypothetical protein
MNKKNKKEKLPTDIVALPVYMVRSKYDKLAEICKSKRMPMTRIAEGEIDKYIARESAKIPQSA